MAISKSRGSCSINEVESTAAASTRTSLAVVLIATVASALWIRAPSRAASKGNLASTAMLQLAQAPEQMKHSPNSQNAILLIVLRHLAMHYVVDISPYHARLFTWAL